MKFLLQAVGRCGGHSKGIVVVVGRERVSKAHVFKRIFGELQLSVTMLLRRIAADAFCAADGARRPPRV